MCGHWELAYSWSGGTTTDYTNLYNYKASVHLHQEQMTYFWKDQEVLQQK